MKINESKSKLLNGEKPEIKTISNIFLELMDGRNI
jgi:hypothetical protein